MTSIGKRIQLPVLAQISGLEDESGQIQVGNKGALVFNKGSNTSLKPFISGCFGLVLKSGWGGFLHFKWELWVWLLESLGEILVPALCKWLLAFKPTNPGSEWQWAELKRLNCTCPRDMQFEY